MGLILMAALFAGCLVGLLVSCLLGAAGVVLMRKIAKARLHVWRIFAVGCAVALPLCLLFVHLYPYATVNPGSDYDVAMTNYLLLGLGYCASPGTAVLLAAVATRLVAPRRP